MRRQHIGLRPYRLGTGRAPSERLVARQGAPSQTATDGGGLEFRLGPEPELAAIALGTTWWVFVQVLDLMHELCGLPTEALQEAADAGAELFGIANEEG